MITFFTIPKSFAGHIGVIQRNAIQSWTLLRPRCEVLLLGNDATLQPVARELGVRALDGLACNRFGTPLVSAAFRLAAAQARHELLCYVNADILLRSDFPAAVARLPGRPFLMVGQRWDVAVTQRLDFTNPRWEAALARRGRLHRAAGSDYFVFPRGCGLEEMPDFAVGRQGWDNWLIGHARRSGIPVVDATFATCVLHQDHDYAHIPDGDGCSYQGIESEENLTLFGEGEKCWNLAYVTHLLLPDGLRASPRSRSVLRRMRKLHGQRRLFAGAVGTVWGRVRDYWEGYRHCPPVQHR